MQSPKNLWRVPAVILVAGCSGGPGASDSLTAPSAHPTPATLTDAADGRFSSAIIVGEPFEWTVSGSPGTEVPYICSIHPSMTGLLTIAGD